MPSSRRSTHTTARPVRQGDTTERIIAAARALIDAHGVDALSLDQLMAQSGPVTGSLARRFADRQALVDAVRQSLFRELASDLHKAESNATAYEAIIGMGAAYRAFAARHAQVYQQVTPSGEDASSAALEVLWPIIDAFRRFVGPESALLATRTLISYLHGFAVMEANENFQLIGSIDDTFDFGLHAVVDGIYAQRDTRQQAIRSRR